MVVAGYVAARVADYVGACIMEGTCGTRHLLTHEPTTIVACSLPSCLQLNEDYLAREEMLVIKADLAQQACAAAQRCALRA